MALPYEIRETGGTLVVARSRASVGSDVFWLALGFVFALACLAGWAWASAGQLLKPGNLLVLAIIVVAIVGAGSGLRRSWSLYRHPELIVLDRANDSVVRAGQKACALADVERVVLRRFESQGTEYTQTLFEVALTLSGLRGRGAPRGVFADRIEVCTSPDETEMRRYAGRVAGYAGVVIEEQGT
jgi:hypothetical protein